tara:strand:+ start:55 stop:264 length:210 start_codon:yes stop_codon:yes gene_type:complete
MKNLKQSVINKGWVDIQDEILGTTITISKNDFWFSIAITNEEKGLDLHTIMVVKTWKTIRKWLSKHNIK